MNKSSQVGGWRPPVMVSVAYALIGVFAIVGYLITWERGWHMWLAIIYTVALAFPITLLFQLRPRS